MMFGIGPMEMLVVSSILLLGGGGSLPLSMPPLPPDPVVQRAAPEECLLYLGLAGSAKADPKSNNQTEQLLAEPEVSEFVSHLQKELIALWQRSAKDPASQTVSQELPVVLRAVLTRPATFFVSKVTINASGPPPDVQAGLVVNTGTETATVRKSLDKLEALILADARHAGAVVEMTIAGVKLRQLPMPPGAPALRWGFKNEYLIVTVGEDTAKDLIARLDSKGKLPSWLVRLQQQLPVDRPGVVGYFNVAGVLKAAGPVMDPKAPPILDALGISNVKSLASVSGFDVPGMVSKSLVEIEGEPAGIFAIGLAKPLTPADLKAIPQDTNFAIALRLDLAQVYRRVLAGIAKVEPAAAAQAKQHVAQVETQLGIHFEADLLEALGDVWRIYNSPNEGGALWNGAAAVVSVRDQKKLQATYEKLLAVGRPALEQQGVTIKELEFQGEKIYYAQSTRTPIPVSPAWCLAKDQLIIALNPQMVKSILSRPADSGSLASVPSVAAMLKTSDGGPITISYHDTKTGLQAAYMYAQLGIPMLAGELGRQGIQFDIPTLPSFSTVAKHALPSVTVVRRTKDGLMAEQHSSIPLASFDATTAAPVMAALLLPAIQAAREAARRTNSMNNLKQIAIAMMNHEVTYRSFPAAAIYDKDQKPLLSWRVKILPYLEEDALYKQFHLDEPWDSEHNRQLIDKMPATLANPNFPELNEAGKTAYLVPTGKSGLFNGTKGPTIRSITDGLSKTIMVVEAGPDRAVIWTKPDDIEIDPKDPSAGLRGARVGGFLAVFADGAVRFISDDVDARVLLAIFTPNGGEQELVP